jgi:hypothetical protein
MATTGKWRQHEETHAFLVALDISDFSRHMQDPDQLLEHRMRFFRAIEQTRGREERVAQAAGPAVS